MHVFYIPIFSLRFVDNFFILGRPSVLVDAEVEGLGVPHLGRLTGHCCHGCSSHFRLVHLHEFGLVVEGLF